MCRHYACGVVEVESDRACAEMMHVAWLSLCGAEHVLKLCWLRCGGQARAGPSTSGTCAGCGAAAKLEPDRARAELVLAAVRRPSSSRTEHERNLCWLRCGGQARAGPSTSRTCAGCGAQSSSQAEHLLIFYRLRCGGRQAPTMPSKPHQNLPRFTSDGMHVADITSFKYRKYRTQACCAVE